MAPQPFNPTAIDTNLPPHDPLSAWENEPAKRQPVRGIGWVLRSAFVLAVFSVVGVLITQLLMLTIAEQYLIQAAQAGAREAALPQATVASVTKVVTQRWRNWSHNDSQLRVAVRSQNRALKGLLSEELRGSIYVDVAVSASVVLPRWIQPRNFRWGPQVLHATASG